MAATEQSSGGSPTPEPIRKLEAEADQLRRETAASLEYAERLEKENQALRAQRQLQDQHLTPMTVNKLQVRGAPNTRRSFLDPLFAPLVAPPTAGGPTTLGDVLLGLQTASGALDRFGVFHPSPEIFLAASGPTDPSSSPTDVDVDVVLRELPRYKFNAGTDVGNSEGSAFTSLLWRNVFGGAEQLTLNASAGTRTRSAYTAELSGPVLSDPGRRLALELLSSATEKPWASHEEVLRGGSLRYSWLAGPRDQHSLEYVGMWRQVTGLAGAASPTVRADAGDSVKSALRHTYRREARDNPQLPQSGYHLRSMWELAGVGPLGGDVAFSRSEFECGAAVPVPRLPGASLGAGLRTGMLYPLAPGFFSGRPARPSRVNDRFQLGGPTDVRGFKLGGLGPHDGNDAVGGDLFAAGSLNLLLPLPYKGPESSLRLQLFANAGRLVALRNPGGRAADEGMSSSAVARAMLGALGDLAGGPPSVAAGVGLVYAHPVARFELNFGLPLTRRAGEVGAKGVQVGVGINFL